MIADYVQGCSVEEILARLQKATLPVRVLAGGTDLLPRLRLDLAQRVEVVDISGASDLKGIVPASRGLRLGAATKLAAVVVAEELSGNAWQVLSEAASLVGSPQIRNLATLGGNICNASPAADTVPALLALDAQAELVSARGVRSVPLSEFFVGPGRTVLDEDEILASVLLPEPPPGAVAAYLKHSPRRAMDLAVVGVGVLLAQVEGRIAARIALGAVAPTPLRARQAEEMLRLAPRLNEETIAEAARLAALEARPISDVRASAEYRTAMIETLTRRALAHLAATLE